MSKIYFTVFFTALLAVLPTFAAEDIFGESDDVFFGESETGNIEKNNDYVSDFLENKLPASTLYNIKNKEKIFCYIVDYASPSYDGYKVNDMAIKGYCGELSNEGEKLISDAVLKNTSLYSNNIDNCNVSPKFMLRYINGIDHTDVLFSDPCPSLTFFHGHDIITINAAPGKEIIQKIIDAYVKLNEKFLSPALLGQVVGSGQVITQDQKEIVRRLSPTESSLKKWGSENDVQKEPQVSSQPKATGWNRLK